MGKEKEDKEMGNVTFMIGNGFDLACGLKSRYVDSYDGYLKSAPASEVINQFRTTIEKDIKTWAEFEMKLAEYAHVFKSESELIECLSDYKSYLNAYLLQEQQHFFDLDKNIDYIDSAVRREMARSLEGFFDGLTPKDKRSVSSAIADGWPQSYQFISFNYTTVFDKLVEDTFSHGEIISTISHRPVIHIHGILNNDVVLGIDNELQLLDIPYSLSNRGKRNIIKPYFVDQYDDKRKADAQSYIRSSNVICIFGMALGDSDLTWKKSLAEWLSENGNRHLVYYKHSLACRNYPPTAITRKMDDEEDYKEVLLKMLFGEAVDSETYKQLSNQIHIPTGFSIFNVKQEKSLARIEYIKKVGKQRERPRENGIK